ncbi:Plasmodium exported protein (PHIST), unknown function [Plasmodium berghei]|uniref:Plasmodium RESA N-terminal domain-containing protein n=2 Tax=Plasmodium berghei TaxID=5821 RepID=A0A509AJH2_PLABA|nr:Plasmodium exported protein (PHIST), unknown function [Plasmodium berghei ANKA]CXI22406.1 Plasmodium exported protein (PHIST), unknown function [Plasmodium berghei]SCM20095.1 Plasmodium exported protein (PHIST), unknown function [Plasmodium berghei]SCN23742.1 Plasmodium exported protein (PHIST), unknown function [Plasmodium berghei]SCO60099.1 Plasmodium exported protein (PHIST), unknown function [Plasmodium berghei]VUC54935.1 Plasmodium exported protein (PHIST), unknown function [Plasmodium|eukprot:XP_034420755.1 Plasmodium exported protein (PHIST), unknown function [Plasmodium berghei ANKA]
MDDIYNICNDDVNNRELSNYTVSNEGLEHDEINKNERIYNEDMNLSSVMNLNNNSGEMTMYHIDRIEGMSMITLEEEYTHCDILTEDNELSENGEMNDNNDDDSAEYLIDSNEMANNDTISDDYDNNHIIDNVTEFERVYDNNMNIFNLWKKLKEILLLSYANNKIKYSVVIENKCIHIIYSYFRNFERKKYMEFRDKLWKICEAIVKEYNVEKKVIIKEWDMLTTCVLSYLLERNRNYYNDLYNLMKCYGRCVCCKIKFIEHIEDKISEWRYNTSDFMFKRLENAFVTKLMKYAN